VEDELERELSLHLEQLTREQMEAGLSEAEARRAARRAFGSPDLAKEQCRDARRVGLLEDLYKDAAYALRLLARSPGFALTAVLSLAFGIGANTAIFSLVDTVLRRLLPVERPQELVFLHSVREQTPRFAFVPLWQPLDRISRITLAVSSDQPPPAVARAVADEVRAVHPNTLVSDVIGVEEQIDATLVSERLLSMLATVFAALALGLAAIGLYGILSYSVARRRAEFGVRMALGAAPSRVASSVFREVLLQVAAGMGIGLPVALATARATEGLLFGVTPADPGNYLLSAAVLAVVACLAAWLPARRACSIDPSEILKLE
jgi:hypothetical protein